MNQVSNYSPFILLSILSKVLESHMVNLIRTHLLTTGFHKREINHPCPSLYCTSMAPLPWRPQGGVCHLPRSSESFWKCTRHITY